MTSSAKEIAKAYVPNELLSRLVGDRLVAVTFVLEDYLQLQFDEAHLNVGVWPELTFDGRRWRHTDLGYADVWRRMCGSEVTATSERASDGLRIALTNGEIHINPARDEVYKEIALLSLNPPPGTSGPGEWMCWRPGGDLRAPALTNSGP